MTSRLLRIHDTRENRAAASEHLSKKQQKQLRKKGHVTVPVADNESQLRQAFTSARFVS